MIYGTNAISSNLRKMATYGFKFTNPESQNTKRGDDTLQDSHIP